jgi:hypothetical protein
MCGPNCWYCPICSGGESRNSDYIRMDDNSVSHEYRWSCRQYFCCLIQLFILAIIGVVLWFGPLHEFVYPNNTNSSNSTYFMNNSNWTI